MFLPEWIARHAFAASAFPFRGVRAFFSALLNFAQRVRCLILGPPPYVDPMDRHIENREYHEGFMRQAIDMVSYFLPGCHGASNTFASRASWLWSATRLPSAASSSTRAKSLDVA